MQREHPALKIRNFFIFSVSGAIPESGSKDLMESGSETLTGFQCGQLTDQLLQGKKKAVTRSMSLK
jgi:hypothetical protein